MTTSKGGVTLTRIVEVTVYGLRSYHYECDCGKSSVGYEREVQAVMAAKRHGAREHSS